MAKLAGVFSRLIISTRAQMESEGKDQRKEATSKNREEKMRAR
jgi:hypothetical protein